MKKENFNSVDNSEIPPFEDQYQDKEQREGEDEGIYITRAQVAQMIDNALSSLRVYVLESDITQAQNSVKAIIEQATF